MIPGLTTKISEEVIASTTTISPLSDLVLVSGTTSIATIVPPPNWGGRSSGIMILVATDAAGFALVTTGNIALAVTLTTGKTCVCVWSASQAKWYPGTIS